MGFFGPSPETFAVDIGNPGSADQLTRYLTDIAGPIYRPGDLTEAAAWRQVAALERIAAGIETIVENITAPQAPPVPTPPPMPSKKDQQAPPAPNPPPMPSKTDQQAPPAPTPPPISDQTDQYDDPTMRIQR